MCPQPAGHKIPSESDFELEFILGDAVMDATHREFLVLTRSAAIAPATELAEALHALFTHTQDHFDAEEARMRSIDHKQLGEHRADHQRILGDMERFYQRAANGRGAMARAWVGDSLMAWFAIHARTMDSALAAELAQKKDADDSVITQ